MANVVAVLAAKGLPPTSIAKLTTFLVGDMSIGDVAQTRAKHLGEYRPASTAVWVPRLVNETWLIEIEAIAVD